MRINDQYYLKRKRKVYMYRKENKLTFNYNKLEIKKDTILESNISEIF